MLIVNTCIDCVQKKNKNVYILEEEWGEHA